MTTSKLQGHPIIYANDQWLYEDTFEPTIDTWQERGCGRCGKPFIKEGAEVYDGCIGKVAGATNACCGHGVVDDMYIQFEDGIEVRGENCMQYFNKRDK